MLILTPEQKTELEQLQVGYACVINPLPIANSENVAINEAFLGDDNYSHLWAFLNTLPSDTPTLKVVGVTLGQAKAAMIARINQEADRRLNTIVEAYPQSERATWPEKIKEAESLVDHGVPSTYLYIEATERNVSVEYLAEKVLEKSDEFHRASAKITGVRGKHTDAVMLLTTVEDVQNYDHLAGWD